MTTIVGVADRANGLGVTDRRWGGTYRDDTSGLSRGAAAVADTGSARGALLARF